METTKKRGKLRYIIAGIVAVIVIIGIFIATVRVETVTYEGNLRLTDEELNEYILGEGIERNPIVLWFKNMFGEKAQIPFVEEYEVELKSLSSVKVTVYEKSIVGYISYMGTYMYFDKDGIVVENSSEGYEDIPEITGVSFDNIVLHSKIPLEDERVFDLILAITQLIKDVEIKVHKIRITELMEVTLYINQFRVALGSGGSYGEKISELADILPEMIDIPGELDMTEVDISGNGYNFKKD